MKYIRTKDGIFDLSRFKFEKGDIDQNKVGSRQDCYWEQNDIEYCPHRCIWVKDIIARADTIEELCDELVYDEKEGKPFLLDKNEDEWLIDNYKSGKCGDDIIYGEIWVDGELHKAAKMNKEGELELL